MAHFKWSIHAASLGSSRLRLIGSYHSLIMYPMLGGAHGNPSTLQLHSGSLSVLLLFFEACCVTSRLTSLFDCVGFKLCQGDSTFPDLWKQLWPLLSDLWRNEWVNHLFSLEYPFVGQKFCHELSLWITDSECLAWSQKFWAADSLTQLRDIKWR